VATPDGSGVMLLRAWVQNGEVVGRVRWSLSPEEEQQAQTLVGTDAIEAAVAWWLRRIEAGHRG
jgi:hypothetical protein